MKTIEYITKAVQEMNRECKTDYEKECEECKAYKLCRYLSNAYREAINLEKD